MSEDTASAGGNEIVLVLYEGLAPLDIIGPFEVLQHALGYELKVVATTPGPVGADGGGIGLVAQYAYEDTSPDVIVVPGGAGGRDVEHDEAFLEWLRAAHETTSYTTSVCTGALILGAAGILDGVDATTHWAFFDELAAYGANPLHERVVERDRIITAAGVSAGIDMALTLASRLVGDEVAKAIQLGIEYDPQPPFDSGSVHKADPDTVDLVRAVTVGS